MPPSYRASCIEKCSQYGCHCSCSPYSCRNNNNYYYHQLTQIFNSRTHFIKEIRIHLVGLETWAWALALPCVRCVTLDRWLSLSLSSLGL